MNPRYVVKQLGLLFLLLSAILLGLAVTFNVLALISGPPPDPAAIKGLLLSSLIGAVAGGIAWLVTRRASAHLGRRDAMLLVAGTWIIGAAFAALPFYFWATISGHTDHPFSRFVD